MVRIRAPVVRDVRKQDGLISEADVVSLLSFDEIPFLPHGGSVRFLAVRAAVVLRTVPAVPSE